MKYAVMMGSGVMTYIPSFVRTGSGIQQLRGREDLREQTRRPRGDLIQAHFYFLKIKKVG
jgi:hypothetical protein